MHLLKLKIVSILVSLTSGSLPVFIQTRKDRSSVLQ